MTTHTHDVINPILTPVLNPKSDVAANPKPAMTAEEKVTICVHPLRLQDMGRFELWGHHSDLRFRCYDFPDLKSRPGGYGLNQAQWFYKRNIPHLRWVYTIEDDAGTLKGYFKIVKKHIFQRRAELTMVLDPTAVGKGYGSQAVMLQLGICFEKLRLDEVWVSVVDFNTRSIRLLEKTGFEVYNTAEEPYDDQTNSEELLINYPECFSMKGGKLMCRLRYLKFSRKRFQQLKEKG